MFWPTGPPEVGNREILFFSSILASDSPWHRNSRRKTENHNLPALGAFFSGGKTGRPNVCPQNPATFLCLPFRPTGPPRTGNREIPFLRPLWPRRTFGTWRNSGRKSAKRNCPVLGAVVGCGEKVRPPTKPLLETPQLFYVQHSFRPDPHGLFFKAVLAYNAPGHLEKNARFLGL